LGAAYATVISVQLLSQACQVYREYTYEDLVDHVLGGDDNTEDDPETRDEETGHQRNKSAVTVTTRFVQISLLVFCVGCAVAYCVAIQNLLDTSGLYQLARHLYRHYIVHHEYNHDDSPSKSDLAMAATLVWLTIQLPLSLSPTMRQLQKASAVGVMSVTTLVVACVLHWYGDKYQSWAQDDSSGNIEDEHGRLREVSRIALNGSDSYAADQSSSDSYHGSYSLLDFLWPVNGLQSILTAAPIILFAYSCQINVCAIYAELDMDQQRETGSTRTRSIGDDAGSSSLIDRGDLGSLVLENDTPEVRLTGKGFTAASPTMTAATMSTSQSVASINTVNDMGGETPARIHLSLAETEVPSRGLELNRIPATHAVHGDASATTAQDRSGTCRLRRMTTVATTSVTLCSLLYGGLSLIVLSDVGPNIDPNLLNSYGHTRQSMTQVTLLRVAASAILFAVVLAFPLNIFPGKPHCNMVPDRLSCSKLNPAYLFFCAQPGSH
jgi:Transmembrane amino acid transporter protein